MPVHEGGELLVEFFWSDSAKKDLGRLGPIKPNLKAAIYITASALRVHNIFDETDDPPFYVSHLSIV